MTTTDTNRLPEDPADLRLGRYQHYKTRDLYDVIAVAKNTTNGTADGLPVVVYRSVSTGQVFARDHVEFVNMIDVDRCDGEPVPRFVYVGPTPAQVPAIELDENASKFAQLAHGGRERVMSAIRDAVLQGRFAVRIEPEYTGHRDIIFSIAEHTGNVTVWSARADEKPISDEEYTRRTLERVKETLAKEGRVEVRLVGGVDWIARAHAIFRDDMVMELSRAARQGLATHRIPSRREKGDVVFDLVRWAKPVTTVWHARFEPST